MKTYFGSWDTYEEMRASWAGVNNLVLMNFPDESEVIFASYGGGSYEGDALVIFTLNGKLHEASGSHCSCNDLEGDWLAEATSWAALKIRTLDDHDDDAKEAWAALLAVVANLPS